MVLTWLLLLIPALPATAELFELNTSYPPPYGTEDEQGILDRVLREAFSRIGHDVRFLPLPAERALLDANSGIADGVVARVQGIEALYPNLLRVPSATIASRDFVAFSREGVGPIRNWDDLVPFNVVYVRGWKIVEQNVPQAKSVLAVDGTRRAFRLLSRGRADVVINARLDGSLVARQERIGNLMIHEPPLTSLSLYPYLHVDHYAIVPDLAAALDAMKADGSFARIHRDVMQPLEEDLPE
jgi:polar amino acid transport system substrate-binding protein